MRWDYVEANWTQFRSGIKLQWSRLNDAHLDAIAGSRERLILRIRQLYGISQEQTEKQVDSWAKRATLVT